MAETTPKKSQIVAAYLPFRTFLTAADALKQGVPRKLDASAFSTFSGAMQSWTLSAYRFFGFTDHDGLVQSRLHEWVGADEAGRKGMMRHFLVERYPEIVHLAEEHGTANQMREAMERLGVSGATRQKAITFFLRAADFAGLRYPPGWKRSGDGSRRAAATPRRARRSQTNGAQKEETPPPTEAYQPATSRTIRLRSGGYVALLIDADPWATSEEDRQFLFRMVDVMREYEQQGLTKESGDA